MKQLFITLLLASQLSVSLCAEEEERERMFPLEIGLTPHFVSWLDANGYGGYNFNHEGRADFPIPDGAYGGKENDDDTVERQPVIFLVGNANHGVGQSEGGSAIFEYFRLQGYKKSELYVSTWGSGDSAEVWNQAHYPENNRYCRMFVEAVLAYTGAEKVDIVGHSFGVTFGRSIIKGGVITAAKNPMGLGPPLTDRVDTFVGIAGANYGIGWCLWDTRPICNHLNGYYAGIGEGPILLSRFLQDLNDNPQREGDHIFSMYSVDDWLIGDKVFG